MDNEIYEINEKTGNPKVFIYCPHLIDSLSVSEIQRGWGAYNWEEIYFSNLRWGVLYYSLRNKAYFTYDSQNQMTMW